MRGKTCHDLTIGEEGHKMQSCLLIVGIPVEGADRALTITMLWRLLIVLFSRLAEVFNRRHKNCLMGFCVTLRVAPRGLVTCTVEKFQAS